MDEVVHNRILKDANGQISHHFRSHIHLTNCIHLKNHMHKQSPMMADRSMMRDLLVLQRSRSLRDPSASPPSPLIVQGRRSVGVDNRRESRRLSAFSPPFSVGGAIMSDRSGKSRNRGSRKNRREEFGRKSDWDVDDLVNDVISRDSGSKLRKSKQKGKYSQDFPIKTLSEQLNEVGLDVDVAKRREFRSRATPSSRIGAQNELSVASSSMAQTSARPRHHLEEKEEEESGDHNVTRIPKNGCGIPFNWSRIHHRGKSFLGMAGRSLSCGLSDTKLRRELDIPAGSDYSGSSIKSDAEAPLLNDPESSENVGWVHDYSGELSLCADHLLENDIDIDSDLASEAKLGGQWKRSRHQNLAQKYTPKTFGDLVGQNLVAQVLSNAVIRRKIGLLYVFYGPHGTGKTSCARIFAMALNCLSLEHPKPCGHCSSCIAHERGKSRNVREVGPVSNFDFEKIMDLLDNMIISQLPSQYRVFIFDDCDSLSLDSWSALTKVIDRAPRCVVFVLVSSSLDVLPHIIVSRCQKFFFPKLKDADITYTLQWIASRELIDIDEDALKLIASRSDGSLRDAEMTLEQLGLLGLRISVPLVQELVGLISDEKLVDLLDFALSADTANTVKNLRVIMESGVEPLTLMSQLATVITDILAGTYDFTKERNRRKFFRRQPLSKEHMEKLRQALKTLSEAEKQIRVSDDKVTWLTAALLQLAPDQQNILPNSSAGTRVNRSSLALNDPNGRFISRKGESLDAGKSEIVEIPPSPREIGGSEENNSEFIKRGVMMRTSLGEFAVSPEKSSKGSLSKRSIVRSKVPLAHVLQQADHNSWSKHKAVSIAEKLEQENLRLEPRSRNLLCWKASRATHRKHSRLRIRTQRRSHSLLKLVSCGKCLSSRSPR